MTNVQDGDQGAVNTDRPVEAVAHDKLGRSGFALSIARQIRMASRGESFVIALVGPWGSGKTSILNMAAEHLRAEDKTAVLLRFNPWLFAGHQQLVAHFFQEIAAQLREDGGQEFRDVWRGFDGYSRLLRPLRPISGTPDEQDGNEASVRRQRKLLENALQRSSRRLVIAFDDIDRLQDEEIRDVMRLVRLVADFPNVVYVLLYDQTQVERALGGEAGTGRTYLEKVVQVVHQVPELRPSDLSRLLGEKVTEVVQAVSQAPSDNESLQNIFHRGVRHLIHNIRDINRYVNALRPTLGQLRDEVALSDVLAMEALRVLHPDVFYGIIKIAPTFLLRGNILFQRTDENVARSAVSEVLGLGGSSTNEIRELLLMVFPTLNGVLGNTNYGSEWMRTWRRHRRIAHPDVLNVYLSRALLPGALPSRTVREFLECLGDGSMLVERLGAMSPPEIEELLGRLEDYQDEFLPEVVPETVRVLADQLPRLREGRSEILDLGAELALQRVILRLLTRVAESDRVGVLDSILPRIGNLSSRRLVITVVNDDKIVNAEDAARFVDEFAREVLKATPEQLASERDLMLLLHEARKNKEVYRGKLRELVTHDSALVRILTSGLSEGRSGAMGSVVQAVQHWLPWWDDLLRAVGEGTLAERVRSLGARGDGRALCDREKVALNTALRYVEGWRPKHFGRSAEADDDDDEAGVEIEIEDAEAQNDGEEINGGDDGRGAGSVANGPSSE